MMRSDWPRILLLFACGLAGAWQLGKIPPLLPYVAAELGLDGTLQGLIASSITFLSIGLFGLAALASARLRPALGLGVALALTTLGAGLSALATGPALLLVARMAEGLGYVYLIVACPTGMAALARGSRDQGIALSVWGCFVPLGIALGGAAASAMEPGFGWRGGMAVAAIPPAVMLVLAVAAFARMAPLGSDRLDALPDTPIPIAGAGRAGLALAAGFGFFAANFLALMAFLPTRWQALGPMDAGLASIAFAAVSVTSIGGSLFVAARLARGGNAQRLAMLGLVLQGGFGIAALLLPDRGLSILAAGLAIGLGGFTPAAAFALGPRITASGAGLARLNGWISGLGSAGSFVGAPAMGWALDHAGWTGGSVLLLGLTGLGVAAFLAMGRAKPA